MNSSSVSKPIPTWPLGNTGHGATLFALGGEGVLRTHGRIADAVAVIQRALDLGVIGCRTPAEVEATVRAAREFCPMIEDAKINLENRPQAREAEFTSYKRAG